MEALAHLRHIIAALDEAVVDSLCVRAQRRLNSGLYDLAGEKPPVLATQAARFAAASTLAARIQVLRPGYLADVLPVLCEPGEDTGQPACLSADGACLDALTRRLALSVHVATRKKEALPPALQAAVLAGDPAGVELAITHPAVEAEVLARVRTRTAAVSANPALPDRLVRLYAGWIIPLSRKIQVHGLLAGR